MKYDLREIMKRAWSFKKTIKPASFSACLKMAWAEAKAPKPELAALSGTPKQIAWAEDIRKSSLSELDREIRMVRRTILWCEGTKFVKIAGDLIAIYNQIGEKVAVETSAKWLIENRWNISATISRWKSAFCEIK